MEYTVLSPWGATNTMDGCALNPRVKDLDHATIGLFAHFKQHSPILLNEIGKELKRRFPGCTVKALQYTKSTAEIRNDPEFDKELKEWLEDVDCVVSALGDAAHSFLLTILLISKSSESQLYLLRTAIMQKPQDMR